MSTITIHFSAWIPITSIPVIKGTIYLFLGGRFLETFYIRKVEGGEKVVSLQYILKKVLCGTVCLCFK